ncbi:hypothetical protein PMG11_08357 [Penicillium brasilianum]|uniref:Uncharacterized protein n=1 Tax=Penicillium brasilianum TaxID=104259 RepID=A0A0F7TV75_PENBI|nr:hypothetical protein PMG11_08357 [Penicillium brasilianum]
MSYALSRSLDQKIQLFGAPYGSTGASSGERGQALSPTHTVSIIMGLERMDEIARFIGTQAQLSQDDFDTLLWNETAGYYAAASGDCGYDLMDITQVLLAGIGSEQRQASFVEKLATLQISAG